MKLSVACTIILSTTLSISPVHSEFVGGEIFVKSCNDPLPDRQAACVGFIAGIVDSKLRDGQFCLPPNVTPNEMAAFIKDYSKRSVSQHQPAVNIVMLALKAKWPCVGPRVTFQFNFNGFRGF